MKNITYGLYDDETDLLSAVRQANAEHLEIEEVYSPFPVHGLDPLLGLKESRLHITGFIYGLIGTLTAFLFMTWVFTRSWPIIFGGKPYFSLPAFIPIIFELTVLFSAVGMVITFYVISGMGPGAKPVILDKRITDDKFCLVFDTGTDALSPSNAEQFFKKTGASEVYSKTI